jgi:hypothetical protein
MKIIKNNEQTCVYNITGKGKKKAFNENLEALAEGTNETTPCPSNQTPGNKQSHLQQFHLRLRFQHHIQSYGLALFLPCLHTEETWIQGLKVSLQAKPAPAAASG